MSRSRKIQLEKKIMVFLSSGVFIFSGLYANNIQAAPVFSSGSASDSTVAGVNNTASANSSSAFGYFNTASGIASSAFGWSNMVSGENASAFGYSNEASGVAASALGFKNKADNENASAVGYSNNANGVAASAFGFSNTAKVDFASAFGYSNEANGLASTAVGFRNKADNENASAFGYGNNATGLSSSAIGYGNTASGVGSSTIGYNNNSDSENASAFGYGNKANAKAASAFGFNNKADGENASAFGHDNNATGLSSSAIGFENTASGVGSSAIGYKNIADSENASAFGYGNNASATTASAFGFENTASGVGSSTIGYNNTADSENASAIGYSNNANGVASSAFGFRNTASGQNANAFGYNNTVGGQSSNAFGSSNTVTVKDSTAVGNSNNITAEEAFALGNNTSVSLANSVALGSGSVVFEIHGVTGNSAYTQWVGVNDVVGAVSVGSGGATRQIQNVAAGRVSADSTDAVNGSQLYQVQQQIAGQEVTVKNGDSNVVVTPKPGANGGTDYEVKLGDKLDVGGNGTAVIDGTGDGKISVGTGGKVVLDGSDGSVKAGGVTINKNDEGTVNGLTNTTWDPDHITSGQAATEDQLKAIHDTAAGAAAEAGKHSTVSAGDNNLVIDNSGTNGTGGIDHQVRLNDVIEIGSGANKVTVDGNNGKVGGLTNTTWDADNYATGQAATEDQLKAVHDSAAKYDVDSNGNINKNKITLEGTGGTKIGNVAAGEVSATSMDAVNGSQLYQVQQEIGSISNDITRLGDEIDSVGALSAAMAGLHPRFQDGNKSELAMAYGGYGGKSALAVGGFYAPNEKIMFSLGMGISEGGSKMGNFGVNFALDRSPDRKKAPRDIVYTRKEVDSSLAEQDQKIQMLLAKVEEQSREIEALKAKIN